MIQWLSKLKPTFLFHIFSHHLSLEPAVCVCIDSKMGPVELVRLEYPQPLEILAGSSVDTHTDTHLLPRWGDHNRWTKSRWLEWRHVWMACRFLLSLWDSFRLEICWKADSPLSDTFINSRETIPPTNCSAWPYSASRLKPINISCLINKWNSLFSYLKVAY